MDRESNGSEARRSTSLGQAGLIPSHFDDDTESDRFSEAEDIGDRALDSLRQSLSGSLRLNDNLFEIGRVFPNGKEVSHSTLPDKIISHLPTNTLFHGLDGKETDNWISGKPTNLRWL